jgi:uncharacterized protein YqjF (DUF2071 family)
MRAPPPPRVTTAVMIQQWRWMTFIHWRYPPEVIQPLLPAGLTAQTFDGAAWVGLLPFLMDDVRLPRAPAVPWLSRFPETNLRTYVHAPDGGTGIFFLSLDAARLPAVAAARAGLRLPYCWSDMAVNVEGDTALYRGRRRLPGPTGAGYEARVRFGEQYREPELTPLDHFLTARHRLYTVLLGRLVAVNAQHPPWQLRRANLLDFHQDIVEAAGLPTPDDPPVVQASNGVTVRIGLPQLAAAPPARREMQR